MTRDELRKKLNYIFAESRIAGECHARGASGQMIEHLEQVITQIDLIAGEYDRLTNRWIPASTNPEKYTMYIVALQSGDDRWVSERMYNTFGWDTLDEDVTHWMEKPELPEVKE